MSPEETLKEILWLHLISVGESMEKFTSWTIAGIAGVVVLIIGNVESVTKIISSSGIKVTLTIFIMSLIFGIISKQYGMIITSGIRMLKDLEQSLHSESGQNLIGQLTIEGNQFTDEIAEPFWWPLSIILRRAARKGADDNLTAIKQLVTIFSKQLYSNYIHLFLAALGLLSLVFFLK